ncbi:VacJ family lipoprotein [Roseateles sp. BYS180W]|uniref:VacJ family lipoprotein n=1 Tax=Roseateles rivi TaxID=3299028 RepID=A0ABW7FRE6_9BURK
MGRTLPPSAPTASRGKVWALAFLLGVASVGSVAHAQESVAEGVEDEFPLPNVRHKQDPWERWNRKVFRFNEKLDATLLRPVAEAYSGFVPSPARTAVDNFFGNFGDAWSAVNLLLQGRVKAGVQQSARVVFNTVLGLGGLIDISSAAGIEKQSEDFGMTLGRWGFDGGPYMVLPLLGPSTLRDTVALPLNLSVSPSFVYQDGAYKASVFSLQLVNVRANLLRVTDMLDGIALDKYTFVRDAYLQRRKVQAADDEDDYELVETAPVAASAASAPASAPPPAR